MKEDSKHISFHILHKKGTELKIEAKNLQELIDNSFPNKEMMKQRVEKIAWKVKSTLCIYDPASGEIDRQISDGDINPYSWRLKHGWGYKKALSPVGERAPS